MQLRFQDITRRMQTEWIHASKQLGNLDECAGIGDWMNADAAIEAALRRLQSLWNASEENTTEAITEYQFELSRWVRVLLSQLKSALEGINTQQLASEPSQTNLTNARLLRHDIAQAIRELNAAKDGCNGVQLNASQADNAANEFRASEAGEAGAAEFDDGLDPLSLWTNFCGFSGTTARRFAKDLPISDRDKRGREWLVRFSAMRGKVEACRNASRIPQTRAELRKG